MKLSNKINESLTLKFAQTARQLREQGRKIISLGLGEPDFETPSHIISATNKAMLDGFTRYSNPMGLPDLREKISAKLKNENGADYKPDQIVVTPGAKNAIFLALSVLLKPDDEVINFTPYYVSYVPIAKIAEPECVIHHIKLNKNNFSFDISELEKLITSKTKVILLNSPNNPSGKIFSIEELQILADFIEKNNLYVISDEIYEDLIFGNEKHISISSLNNLKERTFIVNGFSKSFAMTGWRIGYLAAPKPFMKDLIKLQQHINTNTCTFVQKGAIAAMGDDKEFLKIYRNKLNSRFKLLENFISKQNKLRCYIPSAGFFAFIDISEYNMNSNDFCSLLLEKTGVAITPGIACGIDWDDHIRISLAVDNKVLEEALLLIDNFLKNIGSENE